VVRANHFRFSTFTVNGSNPEWNTDFLIPLKEWAGPYSVSFIVWDKEYASKNYLGENQLSLKLLFTDGKFSERKTLHLQASRLNVSSICGQLEIKISLESKNKHDDINQIWNTFLSAKRTSTQILVPELNDLGFEDDDEEYSVSDEELVKVSETAPIEIAQQSEKAQKKTNSKQKKEKQKKEGGHYELNVYSDIIGIAFLEIVNVSNLPPEKNMVRTGFDMDPFVVISFGRKTFRTPYKRHTLNPQYNEKLMFPVQKHEKGFMVNFAVVDKDRLTLNDFVCDGDLSIRELQETAPEPDPDSGVYQLGNNDPNCRFIETLDACIRKFEIPLKLKNQAKWKDCSPTLTVKARFMPYAALRQQLWRGLITAYDVDDTRTISMIELNAMLDSLGSTLSPETRQGFFERFSKSPDIDELSVDEVVMCLEYQVFKDTEAQVEALEESSGSSVDEDELLAEESSSNGGVVERLSGVSLSGQMAGNGHPTERVIQLSNCPVCNQPRLSKRNEIDLVSHLATCASQNWAKMDAMVLDRYITSSQARKRWYTKVVKKVSYGDYKLGANSANILVQDRVTGYILEEKMSVYVRVGIRMLYKVAGSSSMETKKVRGLLRSLTIKQGRRFDSAASVESIVPFIKFHRLDMAECLEPIDKFKK
jgi:phosphatidylserine decarboxylase